MSRSTKLQKSLIHNLLKTGNSYNNSFSGLLSTSVQNAIDEVAIKFTQPCTVNEEVIVDNKTLATNDCIYHHIISNTPSLEIRLPTDAINGTKFLIKGDPNSTENFSVLGGPTDVLIGPDNIYEVIYTGTVWMVLGRDFITITTNVEDPLTVDSSMATVDSGLITADRGRDSTFTSSTADSTMLTADSNLMTADIN